MTGSTVPAGTVTLLLADAEGSTRLWEVDPEAMTSAIAALDGTLVELVARHAGIRPVEQGEGDSFVIAFPKASDAVATALDLQRADIAPIRLRIGIHTGEVQLRDEGNYIGPTINRTARLRNLGSGGQTLLSQVTRDLVADRLPEQVSMLDLGAHRMRDLARPEHVYQLCHPALQTDFPPLRSLDTYPHNLPVQVTTFIGRDVELAELRRLLLDTRLLTLTGAGGSGKTRLALQLAADTLTHYPDGVWWVDLAPLADGDLIASTTARVLGLSDEVGRTPVETIERHLGPKQALILLDNCEHLIVQSAFLADRLLRTCTGLTIVSTSREPLGAMGETAYRVPSLSLPNGGGQASEAVELFVDRASRARPGFKVTDANAEAVEEICRRLDGLPLALELAAARLRAFSPQHVAHGLEDRFRLLATGPRTALPRQQTLRASVDWSYNLLSDAEQLLLRRLSVLAGAFTLEAATAVGAENPVEVHRVSDVLGLLVDKSLVVFDDSADPPRYRLLETIRHYAFELLIESSEEQAVRDRHRRFFMSAAAAIPMFIEAEEFDRIELDLDNFRAAIHTSLEDDDLESAAAIVNALTTIWIRSRIREGRNWYEMILPRVSELDPAVRAWTLGRSCTLDTFARDPVALAKAEECVALAREIDYKPGLAMALVNLAITQDRLGLVVDRSVVSEFTATARHAGDPQLLAWALLHATQVLINVGDVLLADALAEECLEVSATVSDGFTRQAKATRAWGLCSRGRPLDALATLEGVLEDARRWNDSIPYVLTAVAMAQALSGATLDAARTCDEAITSAERSGQLLNKEWATFIRGVAALAAGDAPAALERFSALSRLVADMPAYLAEALLANGDVAEARRVADETITSSRAHSSYLALSRALIVRSRLALAEHGWAQAEDLAHEALYLRKDFGDNGGTADTLEVLAAVADPAQASRLLGAAERMRSGCGSARFKIHDSWHASIIAWLHDKLDDDEFERLWREGESMSIDEAVAYATRGRGARRRPSTGWESLTPAERDVVRLVGKGLTNKDIAAKLFVSPRTIQAHLTHIYAKMGIATRVELARETLQRS
jgi:predicted ATPase/class 3 adenylate cyclase/DNA-binding CsgD family transcriptional regulator